MAAAAVVFELTQTAPYISSFVSADSGLGGEIVETGAAFVVQVFITADDNSTLSVESSNSTQIVCDPPASVSSADTQVDFTCTAVGGTDGEYT